MKRKCSGDKNNFLNFIVLRIRKAKAGNLTNLAYELIYISKTYNSDILIEFSLLRVISLTQCQVLRRLSLLVC